MRQGLLRAFLQRHATRAAKGERFSVTIADPSKPLMGQSHKNQRSGQAWQGNRGAQPLGGGEMSGLRGTAHPSSKLTEDQVREIRRLLKAGQSLAELAKRFGVSRTAIRNIGNGRKWRWLAD